MRIIGCGWTEVIEHETKRVHLPIGFGADLSKRVEKAVIIGVIAEDGFAAIAAIHDVVNGAGIFDTQLPGHRTAADVDVAPR